MADLLNTNPNDSYGDDAIVTLSPREHIRLRPGMYIGKLGDGTQADDGIYVLIKEVVDNSVDEFIMGAGRQIDISIEDKVVSVRDYGRGIPQLNIAFLRISVLVPSSTTGSISTPASRASVKAPALKRCISPSFERVPSGKTATEAPREIHSLPSRTICSSASEARPRLMQMSPWRMRYCPKKGVLKT